MRVKPSEMELNVYKKNIWKAMALSYNLGYQESILEQGVRFLLANHTRLSPTSENESYQIEMKSFLTLVHSSNFSKRPIIDGIPQSRQNTHFEFQTSSLEEALSILKYFRLIF